MERNMSDTLEHTVITGASSGIGLELARIAAMNGSDLLIASDSEDIHGVAAELSGYGVKVEALVADLATQDGVDALLRRIEQSGRSVDGLFANAGEGLGDAFVDQDFEDIAHVIGTNVMGTTYLVHHVAKLMREQGFGRILLTGSIAGLMPGSFQAVYNATKAYIDSLGYALRNELEDTGITVTVLMPGPTDTAFFERAGMLDTKVGQQKKDDAADVARAGYAALMRGDAHEVTGMPNKVQAFMSRFAPNSLLAAMHRDMAEPRNR